MKMTKEDRHALADHIESTDREQVEQWAVHFWSSGGEP